jgi:hypothetical protein
MARKYFRSSIESLEAIFEDKKDSLEILEALKEELTHRKTKRAERLRDQVNIRLVALRAQSATGARSSQETPHSPKSEPDSQDEPRHSSTHSRHAKTAPGRETPGAEERTASSPMPPVTDRPEEILSAWTALEVLSPQSYVRPEDLAGGDRTRVAKLNGQSLPWERGEKSRPNTRLYYQVVLGSIRMEPAVACLLERYGDARPEKPGVRGQSALATIVVNRYGELVESPSVGISSFGWGVINALNGELEDLARWPDVEQELTERIEKLLLREKANCEGEEEQKKRPLTQVDLFAAYDTLVHELGLPSDWIEPPEFAIRSYTYFKDPNPPEPLLLNSFFLPDLVLARKLFSAGKATVNLRRYLRVEQPPNRWDLLSDTYALAESVRPGLTHLARWPGPGRYPLVLLQQAAVNLAFRETEAGGLLGINGPPGTGKTTLLRDLVAGVVAQRAEVMVRFDDPEMAFEHSGLKLKVGNGWIHLYRLNPSLRGFEMVVASSNNKAVENVSAELPGLGAISNEATGLRYFKTLSDALHPSETWGAIAAVLGNLQNRSRFKQAFWWDDDNGFNTYLSAAAGSVREIETTNPVTGQLERRLPSIVEAEQPPTNREEALKRWKKAQKEFQNAINKGRRLQAMLEGLWSELAKLPALTKAQKEAAARHAAAIEAFDRLETMAATSRQTEAEAASQRNQADQALSKLQQEKPGLLARFFRTQAARGWSAKLSVFKDNYKAAEVRHVSAREEVRRIEEDLSHARLERQSAETVWQEATSRCQRAIQRLTEAQQKHGVVLPDGTFFSLDHRRRHQMTPWFSQAAQRLRDEVFISAMAVHRAFIDSAAKPLRHNLGALMNAFTTQTLPGADKQALLPDLWASFFLVIPLVSTTFASVHRMLGKLPLESLGWLMVDEAGQALPQAAVGALLRTYRAVVVGDPVQIEPVVVMPETLTTAICRRFGVDPDRYAAPAASVQTLADAASAYTSEFQTRVGSRSVGVPLLVHRRCSEPMFGVSNAIAYSGLMVSAKSPKPTAIRDVLGPSQWIHVEGSGEDKWCREEGLMVLSMLQKLAQVPVEPDLFIITPFVIVADRLRQTLRQSRLLNGWVKEDDWRWTSERIGTVHTVQGREAEAVIFVLGAPYPAQTGARGWAGGRPNLLNVAVTRAKEAIYVIGNRQLWREAGFFRELDKRLP